MNLVALPIFNIGERVIAAGLPHASEEPWRTGAPGRVTRISPPNAGTYRIWVVLDGTTDPMPYHPHQLRKEPTV